MLQSSNIPGHVFMCSCAEIGRARVLVLKWLYVSVTIYPQYNNLDIQSMSGSDYYSLFTVGRPVEATFLYPVYASAKLYLH